MSAGRDWGGLRAILDEARALEEEYLASPLIDCPRCGTPLVFNAAGFGDCPMGHFTSYPGEGHERQ